MRRKGTQTGAVRFKSGAWYIRFSEWRLVKGEWKWAETERKIEDGGRKLKASQALILGNEQHVSKANLLNKAPQAMSTLHAFVELRYKPTIVSQYHGQWKKTVEGILSNHILAAFGRLQMNEIKRPMVQEWVNQLSASYSGQTVKHCANVLKAIFDHAADLYDLEQRNPADRVKLPRINAKQKQALTMDQVQQIVAKLNAAGRPEYGRLVTLLALTGMRIGEAVGLRWKSVDFQARIIHVVESYTANQWGPPKTETSRRILPITKKLGEVLREQLEFSRWTGDDHTVFASMRGTPLDAGNIADRWLKPAVEALKLGDVSWHTFRHTTRTWADRHMTDAEAMAMFGHTSQAMGRRYTHVRQEDVLEAMERATTSVN